MKHYLVLDLETVPDEGLVAAVDGDRTRTYFDQLGRLVASRRAQSAGRSDFLPLPYHRPVAACWVEACSERDDRGALLVEALGAWTDATCPEPVFLDALWGKLRDRALVTFHGRGFDLPVLELRSLKLGLSLPAGIPARQGEPGAHDDLYELLARGGAAPSSLDLYAKLVGLPGKEGVAGKDVTQLYAQRENARITAYCMSDVLQTWFLYLRYRLLEATLEHGAYLRSVASLRQALPRLLERSLEPAARSHLGAFVDRCGPFFEEHAEPARLTVV